MVFRLGILGDFEMSDIEGGHGEDGPAPDGFLMEDKYYYNYKHVMYIFFSLFSIMVTLTFLNLLVGILGANYERYSSMPLFLRERALLMRNYLYRPYVRYQFFGEPYYGAWHMDLDDVPQGVRWHARDKKHLLNGQPLSEYKEKEAKEKVEEQASRNTQEYEDTQAALCLMELPYLWVSSAGRQKDDSEHAEAEEMLDRWNRIESVNAETSKRLNKLDDEIRQLTRGVTTLVGAAGLTVRRSTANSVLDSPNSQRY
jgi:hypothetical protein